MLSLTVDLFPQVSDSGPIALLFLLMRLLMLLYIIFVPII